MAALQPAGGPGGRGGFRFSWQGASVKQAWFAQIDGAMQAEAQEVLEDLRATLHRDTGEMAEKAFAEVDVSGTKRTLRAGSDADHTIYHELKYHPQIRQALDKHAPHISQRIAAARRR